MNIFDQLALQKRLERRNMKSILFLILVFIMLSSIYAQDSHYWNLQYGTKSTLLGGAVIGSVTELSATYYNPGAVALFKILN